MAEQDVENELLDYEEDEEPQAPAESTPAPPKKDVKGSYVSIHSSGFRDFLLKPELLRAIVDCGFEHPSEGTPFWTSSPWPSEHSHCGPLSHLVRGPHKGSIWFPIVHVFSLLQSSMSVFPKPSWAWMSCAKPSLGWARRQSSCWPPCSRSSPSTDRWAGALPPSPELPKVAGTTAPFVKNSCSYIL